MRYLLTGFGALVGLFVAVILFDLAKMVFQSASGQVVSLLNQAIDQLPEPFAQAAQTIKRRYVYSQTYPEDDDQGEFFNPN